MLCLTHSRPKRALNKRCNVGYPTQTHTIHTHTNAYSIHVHTHALMHTRAHTFA